MQATAWRSGWTKGTLAEWAEELLKKVVFKVRLVAPSWICPHPPPAPLNGIVAVSNLVALRKKARCSGEEGRR